MNGPGEQRMREGREATAMGPEGSRSERATVSSASTGMGQPGLQQAPERWQRKPACVARTKTGEGGALKR